MFLYSSCGQKRPHQSALPHRLIMAFSTHLLGIVTSYMCHDKFCAKNDACFLNSYTNAYL